MEKRELGGRGLTVSAMGLGCMGMSEFYGTSDSPESVETIHRALELGVNFLDTSDMYGRGRNEELLRKAMAGLRDRFVVATKFGVMRGPDGSFTGVCGRPDYVRSACEGSLLRLGTDVIDLYYQHRVDLQVPIEDTVGEMSRLVEEGKVLYLGMSEAGEETIRRACAVHPISVLQTEYSLWSRHVEERILPACRELGVGFVSYSPLGRALLAGKVRGSQDLAREGDTRTVRFPRFAGENLQRNLELVKSLSSVARRKGCTPGQLALAWVLSRGQDIVPIPGTTKIRHLEENVGALQVSLGRDDSEELERIFPPGAAAGERYAEHGMKMVEE